MSYGTISRTANLSTPGPYPEIIDNNDSRYEEAAAESRCLLISRDVEQLIKNMGIRNDLAIVRASCAEFCQSKGTNKFRGGAATISVEPDLFTRDQDVVDWLVTRQLIVIKNNDLFKVELVRAISASALAIFNLYNESSSYNLFYNMLLTMAVQFVAGAAFSLRREIVTDAFAIKNASDETLQGGERFLLAFRNCCLGEVSQEKRIAFCLKHSWVDYTGVIVTRRIAQVQAELARRRVPNDPGKEHKIKRLEKVLIG
ncbi:hypothetical protein JYU14_03185 [Simkania negevensis]|uniref:Uncharacterized protein n=1 Tax=Simkania negevensis TaxID=83561 RepID=A0ABS3AQQ4_9BACT|nr:hypothetical protein [Simkania negevensis]